MSAPILLLDNLSSTLNKLSAKLRVNLSRDRFQGRILGLGILINWKTPSSGSHVLTQCVSHAILITGYVVHEDD